MLILNKDSRLNSVNLANQSEWLDQNYVTTATTAYKTIFQFAWPANKIIRFIKYAINAMSPKSTTMIRDISSVRQCSSLLTMKNMVLKDLDNQTNR